MSDLVEILIEDDRWTEIQITDLASRFCKSTLQQLKLDPDDFEISVLCCDDAKISVLNRDFRNKPAATNVLSWPTCELAAAVAGDQPKPPETGGDAACELGDIAIAYETCQKEAKTAEIPFAHHVGHLLVHATLHLLGYNHNVKKDAVLMQDLERQVLATMSVPDPYGQSNGT